MKKDIKKIYLIIAFCILNGGNKESLRELNVQEVERVTDEEDYQKDVPIR